ncbi:ABC transporter substrate-binding protein [Sutcliffiella cohnii]
MKKQVVFILMMVFTLVLAACSGGGQTSSGNNTNGGDGGSSSGDSNAPIESFTYASTSDVSGLSPILTNDSVSANVIEHVYETLFSRDPETGEIIPELAVSFENPDDTTWVIKLREGVTFHDGTPFNAEAVKYTFDKLRDPETAAPRASLLEPVDEITVIDELTVEITTIYPYGPFLASLAHANAAIVSPTADQQQDLMKDPVGTGPFKFVSYTPGDEVVLEPNEDYRNGAPQIQRLVFKVVPEVSTAISMLQTGEVDFIDNLPSEQMKRIESLNNVDLLKQDGTAVFYLTFNHSRPENQDEEFRKAVAASIDRDAFVAKLNGLGVRSDSILGSKVFGHDPSKDNGAQAYDLELASELVEKNNYKDRPIKLLTPNRSNFMLMAEIVQAQLAEAGFVVQIDSMEWATFLDTARSGEYDMTFLSWSNLTQDGSEMFYPNLHSDNIGSSNRAQFNNPAFDELVDASRVSIDPAERLQLLDDANAILLEENAAIAMYHGVVTGAVNNQYTGLILEANGKWNVKNITRK